MRSRTQSKPRKVPYRTEFLRHYSAHYMSITWYFGRRLSSARTAELSTSVSRPARCGGAAARSSAEPHQGEGGTR
eukprot:6188716-Pleurochrysis_carterae.AAC.1